MGELVLQTGVSGCIDAPIASPQEIVDPDPNGVVAIDASGLQTQALDVRHPAGAGKDGVDRYRTLVVVAD